MLTRTDRIYKHARMEAAQACKHGRKVCGDLIVEERTAEASTFLIMDGIGSGSPANIAATMHAARILKLIEGGFSLREACSSLVRTMHKARTDEALFAAFTAVRILGDGHTTVISYEMPAPLIIEHGAASLLPQRFFTLENEVVGESAMKLTPETGLFCVSDGITQSGLGTELRLGWTIDGVRDFINRCLSAEILPPLLPGKVLARSLEISHGAHGDDSTAAYFTCRPGTTLHIMTGPPGDEASDGKAVENFLALDGLKAVAGSTTAEIVARQAGKPIHTAPTTNFFEPPEHFISGIDLVTEGALTLNQLYNVIGEMPQDLDAASPVTKLLGLMRSADRIYFWLGQAKNPAHSSPIFRQLGIMPRTTVVPLIADKLRENGKLVIINKL